TTPGCNNVCAGNYTVTVTDINGCTINVSTTVGQPPPIQITLTSIPTICAGTCITLSATATGGNGAPFQYAWSPNSGSGQDTIVCPVDTTVYTVVATDSLSCTASATVTANVLPLPVVTLSAQQDTVCINSTINILFGTPSGGTYFGAGVGGNNFNASIAGPGVHSVNYRYTGSNGCTDTINISIFVDACTGVETIGGETFVNIYPNPVTNELRIKNAELRIESVEIYDVVGGLVKNLTPFPSPLGEGRSVSVDVSELMPGIYFLKLKTEKGIVIKKLMKD
ncbi:MAG: T9SS type A sorting domain-containing protein, partial [Bacteroidia bacterium]|nr:T9SS type A sorting domain-containing protein [Bacteroidia bacterium]